MIEETKWFLESIGMDGVFFLDRFPKLTFNAVITGEERSDGSFLLEKIYIGNHNVKEAVGDGNVLVERYRAITWMQLSLLEKCMQDSSQAKSMFLFQELVHLLTVDKCLGEKAILEFSKDWNVMWCRG